MGDWGKGHVTVHIPIQEYACMHACMDREKERERESGQTRSSKDKSTSRGGKGRRTDKGMCNEERGEHMYGQDAAKTRDMM